MTVASSFFFKNIDINYMIYVINLKHRTDRLKSIQSQLKDKDYKIIEAIDGVKLYEDMEYRRLVSEQLDIPVSFFDVKYIDSRRNFATMSRRIIYKYKIVSCFLSHMKALKCATDDKINDPIIMEDDAIINDFSFFDMKLPDEYDVVLCSPDFNIRHLHLIDRKGGLQPVNMETPCWTTACYFCNKPKLIHDMMMSGFKNGKGKRKAKVQNDSDKILISSADGWFKNNIYAFGNSYFILPKPVCQGDYGSDLDHTYKKIYESI